MWSNVLLINKIAMKKIIVLSVIICVLYSSCDDTTNSTSSPAKSVEPNQDSLQSPIETGKGAYKDEPEPQSSPETVPSTSGNGGVQAVTTQIPKKDTTRLQNN